MNVVGWIAWDHRDLRSIHAYKTDLRKAGVKAPVGTVQRMTEWVMDDPNMDRLAEACDVIGTLWSNGSFGAAVHLLFDRFAQPPHIPPSPPPQQA